MSVPQLTERSLSSVAEALRACPLPATESRLLMQHVLQASHAFIASHGELALEADQLARFREISARRAAGEPVAYLLGTREFYSLPFRVSPAVLIPRAETELLVDLVIGKLSPESRARVLDLGTGSGCIAVALKKHLPAARITAVDVSQAALDLARENARQLPAEAAAIEFILSDWFQALSRRKFDLIVANPPYVASNDPHLRAGDPRFEPRNALDGGHDGLRFIREIAEQARQYLAPAGWLMFEHGYHQAEACRELLQKHGYADVFTRGDLAGIPRASGGRVDRGPRATLK